MNISTDTNYTELNPHPITNKVTPNKSPNQTSQHLQEK